MNQDEISRIDRITKAIHDVLNGKIPELINLEDQETDEIHQLSQYINRLIEDTSSLKDSYLHLSNGELSLPIKSNHPFAHSLKNLQATFRHLTWQTKQIAEGDFKHRIDFLGEFSDSFNWMVKQLRMNRDELEELVRNRTKELSFLLNTSTKTSRTLDEGNILQLIAQILVETFEYHTYCRVFTIDRSRQKFTIGSAYSIRALKCDCPDDEVYELDNFKFLKKTINSFEPKVINSDVTNIDTKEKDLFFCGLFNSLLILPFVEEGEVLSFALLNEERSLVRSDFSVDFYKTLSNHLSISIHNAKLFQRNIDTFLHSIEALAAAIDERDKYTHFHSKNVTRYSVAIAERMELTDGQVSNIKIAGLLHDIGKIGIKDAILLKPGKLTNEEFDIIKTHPAKAVKILETVEDLKDIIPIIAAHHERYDGRGYPNGLKGDNIPLGARILAIADSFDAMTTNRVYRKSMAKKDAIEEIARCSGTQFDPQIVKVFNQIVSSF